jgi:hypothetical protein
MAPDPAGIATMPKPCPDDVPRACNRIWRYLDMLGVEACERGRITLMLLDRAMETTLAEGGHLTPAAMDALSVWLAERQADAEPASCKDFSHVGQYAHPTPCRQPMAPERRTGRVAWRQRTQAGRSSAAKPPGRSAP